MKLYLFILLVMFASAVNSQTLVDQLNDRYRAFDYTGVISISDLIIKDSAYFTSDELIDVYTKRGTAYYSVSEHDSARKSFIEILRLNSSHSLDPVTISPKILNFYNEVKAEFERITSIPEKKEVVIEPESLVKIVEKPVLDNTLMKNSIVRNLLLPGWGNLYLGDNTKGIILSAASAALLSGTIYYVFQTKSKENDYLKETIPAAISEKYDSYNQSYKIRNYLIAGFAALWIYSQLDLLFFSDDVFNRNFELSAFPLSYGNRGITINFGLKF